MLLEKFRVILDRDKLSKLYNLNYVCKYHEKNMSFVVFITFKFFLHIFFNINEGTFNFTMNIDITLVASVHLNNHDFMYKLFLLISECTNETRHFKLSRNEIIKC